jgi:broad specificity phosphatase PhoE
MRILLLRHLETENNVNHITQGTEDSAILPKSVSNFKRYISTKSNSLRGTEIVALSSLSKRALSTVGILSDTLIDKGHKFMHVAATDLLAEVNFGKFGGTPESTEIDGKTMSDYRNLIMANADWSYPGGESKEQVEERVQQIIETLSMCDKHRFGCVILVGHNRIFRHLLVALGQVSIDRMFDNKLPHGNFIDVSSTYEKYKALHNG